MKKKHLYLGLAAVAFAVAGVMFAAGNGCMAAFAEEVANR